MYSYILIINSTNKYRELQSNMLIWVLTIDEMVIAYTFTMTIWQIVVKSERQQNKPQAKKHNKTEGVKKANN